MKSFEYVITDPVGIHARPAGELAKKAKEYTSTITVHKGDKEAEMSRLMAMMSLGVKQGEEITITVEGDDEEKAAAELQKYFTENL